LFLDP